MGEAIGQMLPAAVGVAISPLPIVAVVLMLVTPRGRVNGPAFVLGWMLGLAVVGAIVLSVASGASASDDGEPATWVSVLELVLGLAALLLGVRSSAAGRAATTHPRAAEVDAGARHLRAAEGDRHRRAALVGQPEEPAARRGRGRRDRADGDQRRGAGDRLGRVRPRRLGRRGRAGRSWRSRWATARATCWTSSRTGSPRNNATIMSVLLVVIAAKLIGDAISGL